MIVLNLALPFVFPGLNISIGGHIGGLIGGAIAALAIDRLGARPARRPSTRCWPVPPSARSP